MAEPTISRRCPTCHVAIRNQAFFCPQCGNKLDPPAKHQQDPKIHDTEEVMLDPSKTMTESDFRSQTMTESDLGSKTMTESDFRALSKENKGSRETGKQQVGQGAPEVGSKLQRVTNKAQGDVIQRVQKFRDMSNVVIDEASYDPSLRFVLVAAALFILFVVIVLLNKFID